DLSTYAPGWVRSAGQALADRLGHYVFISTNAVYTHPELNDVTTEDSELRVFHGPDPSTAVRDRRHTYGSLKALCEREAEHWFPGRTLVVRPCWIFGPGTDHPPVSVRLPARIAACGEVLVAGDLSAPVQFLDVRDLVAWR